MVSGGAAARSRDGDEEVRIGREEAIQARLTALEKEMSHMRRQHAAAAPKVPHVSRKRQRDGGTQTAEPEAKQPRVEMKSVEVQTGASMMVSPRRFAGFPWQRPMSDEELDRIHEYLREGLSMKAFGEARTAFAVQAEDFLGRGRVHICGTRVGVFIADLEFNETNLRWAKEAAALLVDLWVDGRVLEVTDGWAPDVEYIGVPIPERNPALVDALLAQAKMQEEAFGILMTNRCKVAACDVRTSHGHVTTRCIEDGDGFILDIDVIVDPQNATLPIKVRNGPFGGMVLGIRKGGEVHVCNSMFLGSVELWSRRAEALAYVRGLVLAAGQ